MTASPTQRSLRPLRWWHDLPLAVQLTAITAGVTLAWSVGLAWIVRHESTALARVAAAAETLDQRSLADALKAVTEARQDAYWLRIALLATVVWLILVAYRVLTRTLRSIVASGEALVAGQYDRSPLTTEPGVSRESAVLARTFERLAMAMAEREQIARSEILQLREVEQMKTDFVSTVSHELRTPLTSIRGSLGLVLGSLAGEVGLKASGLLQIASQNTDRLIRLINDILDIEKIEAGHVTLRKDRCELRSVLRTTLAGLEGYANEAGVSVVLDAGTQVVAPADADRLVQVFTNLISNAVKFSPAGQQVRVALEAADGLARISVTDHGPGIPHEFRDKIFGKFQQADRSDARRKGGTGLGLAIARAIVELHDGTIGHHPAPGGGTTFVVELPFTPSLLRPTPIGGIALIREDVRPRARPQLLLVDADAGMREVLAALCEPTGDVIHAGTGELALELAQETAIDAVIVDPEFPGVVAVEFVQRLRRRIGSPTIPLLIFSSREYTVQELDGVLLTPAHAFVKSRDSERALVMRLRAVLAVRRAS